MPASVTIHFRGRDISDVMALGRHQFAFGDHRVKPHVHDATRLELILVHKGRVRYRVNSVAYTVREGGLLAVHPGTRHSSAGLPDEKALVYWLILRLPRRGGPLLNLTGVPARSLRAALDALPPRPFAAPESLHRHLDEAIAIHARLRHDRTAAARLLGHVLQFCLGASEAGARFGDRAHSAWRERVLAHIDAHLGEPLGVPELAQAMRLSISGFKARFRRHVGASPADFVMRRRIDAARERLARTNDSITGLAYDLGFSSSQYFATAFKRCVGLTPQAFRRRLQARRP